MSIFRKFGSLFGRKNHQNTEAFQNTAVNSNEPDDPYPYPCLAEKVGEIDLKSDDIEKPHIISADEIANLEEDLLPNDNEQTITLSVSDKLNPFPSGPKPSGDDITKGIKPLTEGIEPAEDIEPLTEDKAVQDNFPKIDNGLVLNEGHGYSYNVKRLESVKRFIVLGTEGNSYYATDKERFNFNIKCVQSILKEGRSKPDSGLVDLLLDTLEEYSCKGRVAKDDAILTILVICVSFDNLEIQKKAYAKVIKICNIPTKLFKFIDMCQTRINERRKSAENPKQLRKRPRKLPGNQPTESSEKDSTEPENKYKKFNTSPMRSSAWGRMRRAGIGAFYVDSNKSANSLLQHVTKYKQRNNWNHKQVLGYCHPKISDKDVEKTAKELVLAYSTRGYAGYKKKLELLKQTGFVDNITSQIENHIDVLEKVANLKPDKDEDVNVLINAINEYGVRNSVEEDTTAYAISGKDQQSPQIKEKRRRPFQIVREHIPNGFLKIGKVWEALLQDMPMTAMLRNLGRMSSFGLFDNNKENIDTVVNAFTDPKRLTKARIHPVKILIALKAYEQGKSGPAEEHRFFFFQPDKKESKRPKPQNPITWRPNRQILDTLDKAFYLSFKQPELKDEFKTGKKFMLALDVSGSMTFQGCFGCEQITPAIAAAALSMVTWNIEDHVEMVAFGGRIEKLEKYGLRKDMKLNQAMSTMRKVNFGSTDCSLPMQYAIQHKIDVDVFIVYTDSDTGYGNVNPSDALKRYRKEFNANAKLIVMAMTSNGFTIADPEDKGMLDIVGFDPMVPEMIAEFVKQDMDFSKDS